jgi:hypothetical protein
MNQSSTNPFRLVTVVFAGFLIAYCIWLLLAELSRPVVDRVLTDSQSATITSNERNERNDATWAAWIGGFRGDLWAQSAYTYSDLLWSSASTNSGLAKALDETRVRLDRALRLAPHQSGSWLLISGLAARYRWSKPDPAEALRMAYYTGPSEFALVPLRLFVVTELQTLDLELQELAQRDLRLLIARNEKPVIVQEYKSASPAGKHFIEQALGEIDPAFGNLLRLGAP